MPYWIMIQRLNHSSIPLLSKNTLDEAKKEIKKQEELWTSQGFEIPIFKIFYGSNMVYSNQN
jgi:hypothetical protein